jgi:hypothetical protein
MHVAKVKLFDSLMGWAVGYAALGLAYKRVNQRGAYNV